MKTSKSYILKGGDKWGQVGTKSPLCPSLSLLKRKGGQVGTRWGQGGDLSPFGGGDKVGTKFYIYPLFKGGYKMFCPPVPPCSSPLGGTNKHFVPSLNK